MTNVILTERQQQCVDYQYSCSDSLHGLEKLSDAGTNIKFVPDYIFQETKGTLFILEICIPF